MRKLVGVVALFAAGLALAGGLAATGVTTSSSSSSSSTPTWAWIVIAILGAAVVGLLVAVFSRDRAGPPGPPAGPPTGPP
jgi:H+/Cl- antiporter ClcA